LFCFRPLLVPVPGTLAGTCTQPITHVACTVRSTVVRGCMRFKVHIQTIH
jgi:hypothetical protein